MATLTEDVETGSEIVLDASNFDVTVHNGMVTMSNPATGQHRTFKIRTQTADADFAPGKRLVSLLVGPNRESFADWKLFAFADEFGVKVWGKFKGDAAFVKFADMLENPKKWAARGVEYMVEARCRRCGRPLSVPSSITDGLGPICREKM